MKLQSKSDNIVPINRFRMSKINHSIHIFTLCLTITTFDSKKATSACERKGKREKMADVEKGETDVVEIQAPKWALWGGKALALLASFSWAFGSIWNFLHVLGNWNCAVAGVLAL